MPVKPRQVKNVAAFLLTFAATLVAAPVVGERLPRLEAGALDGSRLVLPDSARGNIALLGFGYRRESQDDLNSWLLPFRQKYSPADGFHTYEVPMMGTRIPGLLRGVINRAMRNAIAKENRRWVAPFYGDINDYSTRLGVTDRSRVHMFLLDQAGLVRWYTAGPVVGNAFEELRLEVEKLVAEED
jgi:hypothetical protein